MMCPACVNLSPHHCLLPVSAKTVGIDVGLKDVFVTDTGFKTGNPQHTAKYAKFHAKIADCRLDNLHKLFRRPINEKQVVCVESLNVKNRIRTPKRSKAIADASWGKRGCQLQYNADWAGRRVVAIDPFFPLSTRCSGCGYRVSKRALSTQSWVCPECGITHDRDINAAKNIKAAALAVLALGESVSPESLIAV